MPTRWLAYAHHVVGYEFYMRDDLETARAALQESLSTGDVYAIRLLRMTDAELEVRRTGTRSRSAHFAYELPRRRPPECAEALREFAEDAYTTVERTLDFRPKLPVLVTILSGLEVLEYTSSPFGYYVPKHELHKICLPIEPRRWRRNFQMGVMHEYTHAAVRELAGEGAPSWLNEGLAVLMAREAPGARGLLREAQGTDVPWMSLGDVEGFFTDAERDLYGAESSVAYAEAYSAVRFLVDRYGSKALRELLECLGRGMPLTWAMRRACGVWPRTFERHWREAAEADETLLAWAL